jgi:hypothetical protein
VEVLGRVFFPVCIYLLDDEVEEGLLVLLHHQAVPEEMEALV